jgi:hypothetical protein
MTSHTPTAHEAPSSRPPDEPQRKRSRRAAIWAGLVAVICGAEVVAVVVLGGAAIAAFLQRGVVIAVTTVVVGILGAVAISRRVR